MAQLERLREYKYAPRPDAIQSETPEFRAAEARRKEAQRALASGQKLKEETAAEQMARLGLKVYQ